MRYYCEELHSPRRNYLLGLFEQKKLFALLLFSFDPAFFLGIELAFFLRLSFCSVSFSLLCHNYLSGFILIGPQSPEISPIARTDISG